jgi:hypothetical protein
MNGETVQTEKPENQNSEQGTDTGSGTGENTPAPVNTGISSGKPLDEVGGAGLGQPPGADGKTGHTQEPEKQVPDPQDRRDGSS